MPAVGEGAVGRSDSKSGAGREESIHVYICEGSKCHNWRHLGAVFICLVHLILCEHVFLIH